MSSTSSDGGVWLDRALGAAAAVLLLGLLAVTTADVIGRYIFNWPLRGAFEITELLLLALIFAGLPLVSRADEHVTLDFIDAALGQRGRRMHDERGAEDEEQVAGGGQPPGFGQHVPRQGLAVRCRGEPDLSSRRGHFR